ncbi:MAG: PAS domain-containing protein [Caulobacteraceae bacterium]|nr:PAS domain-containing protein [Caulobacteraceae bacterium]
MGFDSLVRRVALAGGTGWTRSFAVAAACVFACSLLRLALTPLLGSLGGSSIFVPGVLIAGLWVGRRGAYASLLMGLAAAWVIAWLHPDPINVRQFGVGVLLTGFVGVFSAEVAAALRRTMAAQVASLAELQDNQNRLRMAHDAGALGTWEWDIASDSLLLSDGYLKNWRILKDRRAAFMDIARKVHPDDLPGILESRRRVLEDGEAYRSEYRVVDDDGQVRWFTSRGEPVRDATGKVFRVHGVNRDVTEQAAAEAALRESEARFRLIADSAPVNLWMGDAQGACLYLNRAQREFWGVGDDYLDHFDWMTTLHPDDREALGVAYSAGMDSQKPFQCEGRYRRADGEWRVLQTQAQPRFGVDGRFEGMIGVNVDVTEARAAENVLRESEARFRAMADSAPAPIWVSSPEGGIEFANQATTRFFGAPTEAILAEGWRSRLHPEDYGRVAEARQAGWAQRQPFDFEARFRDHAGRWRWMRATTQPRLSEAGEFMGYIGIAFDVTEAREAQDFLRGQERRQRFLLQLGDGLRETDEPRGIAAFAERSLGRHLHVARAGFGEIDEVAGAITVVDSWTDGVLDPISGVYTLENYGAGLISELRRGRTVRVEDVSLDPRTADVVDAFQTQGVRARLSVPVMRGGRAVAVFFLHDTNARAWTDEDAALVEEAASRTWTEIERARALSEVRESEERFRSISDSAPILVWVTNADRTRAFVNKTYVEFMGHGYEGALKGDWRSFLHPDDWNRILKEQVAGESSLKPFSLEARYRRADGAYRWLRSFSRPRFGRDNELLGFVGAAYDVTEERQVQADLEHINELLAERVSLALAEKEQAEAALIRSQRLEALGRLTGGVAHDFNNLLTVVVGALDMILKHPDDEAKRKRMAEAAMAAARRGEQLTHQLLAFSRRQALRPALSDVNALIREGEPLIRRAAGDNVEFVCDLAEGEAVVRVDPAQFEAALFNLVVNARDATPEGGRIAITTERRRLADGEVMDIPAGSHIVVRVADTGAGMPPEVVARVFEPFYTTKPQGKGTGLGLSQVYGFAQQSGGGVSIDSREGRGTTVSMFLPASADAMPASAAGSGGAGAPQGPLKILLVEDDVEVAAVAEALLRHLGHEVTRVGSAARALAKLRSKAPYDLLLSDVVMPGQINGLGLAERAREMRPELKIVLTSGYAGEQVDDTLVRAPWPFLRKPYSQEELAAVLSAAVGPSSGPTRPRPTSKATAKA